VALRPRIIVEARYKPGAEKRSSFPILSAKGLETVRAKPQNEKPRFLPVFHGKVDQVLGLNADWCEVHIENKNNEYDWLLNEVDSMQFIVYMGYSNKPMSESPVNIIGDLTPMIHAWVGDISATFGSSGKLITITGGDASYVFNKGYAGDYMARKTPTELSKIPNWGKAPLPDSHLIYKRAWEIIQQITSAKEDKDGKWITPEGVILLPSKDFLGYTKVIEGACKTEYLPNTIPDDEKKIEEKKKIYQINNNTKLEVIDDVCFKSGFYAWVVPGERIMRIGKKEDFKAEDVSPLKSWGGVYSDDEKQREKGSWIKFKKIPHFEGGLQMAVNYWDWQTTIESKNNYVVPAYKKDVGATLVSGEAHFIGSPDADAQIMCWVGYEPVSQEAADDRAYMAVNRVCSQRVVAVGQVPGNPALMPNRIVPIEGCGIWDCKYLAVHTSHACGMVGYSTMFDLRLPDLVKTKSTDEAKKNPMTTIRVGAYVKE